MIIYYIAAVKQVPHDQSKRLSQDASADRKPIGAATIRGHESKRAAVRVNRSALVDEPFWFFEIDCLVCIFLKMTPGDLLLNH